MCSCRTLRGMFFTFKFWTADFASSRTAGGFAYPQVAGRMRAPDGSMRSCRPHARRGAMVTSGLGLPHPSIPLSIPSRSRRHLVRIRTGGRERSGRPGRAPGYRPKACSRVRMRTGRPEACVRIHRRHSGKVGACLAWDCPTRPPPPPSSARRSQISRWTRAVGPMDARAGRWTRAVGLMNARGGAERGR